VARFLSPEWLAELSVVFAGAWPADPRASSLDLGQLVTGVPEEPAGEVRYTIHVGAPPGRALTAGSTDGAGVTLVTAYKTARSLAKGDLTVADAITRGEVKVRGDANLLVEMQGALAALGEEPSAAEMQALLARTTY
jgi:hypothetical protein